MLQVSTPEDCRNLNPQLLLVSRLLSVAQSLIDLESAFNFRRDQLHIHSVDILFIQAELGRIVDVPVEDRMKVVYVQMRLALDDLFREYNDLQLAVGV